MADMTDQFLENRIEQVRLVLQRLWDEGVLVREPYKRFLGSESRPLNPPLTEEQIVEFESANGIELPEDYRLFLSIAGDGGAGPHRGLVPLSWRNPEPANSINLAEVRCSTESVLWSWCHLVCTGKHKGNLIYVGDTAPQAGYFGDTATEYTLVRPDSPWQPQDFVGWYEGWLRLVESGGDTSSYGFPRDLDDLVPACIIYQCIG